MPALPKRIRTLKQIEADYGGTLKVCTLRNEYLAGNLKAIRPRASCNAPILVTDEALAEWMERASARGAALSTAQAKEANKTS